MCQIYSCYCWRTWGFFANFWLLWIVLYVFSVYMFQLWIILGVGLLIHWVSICLTLGDNPTPFPGEVYYFTAAYPQCRVPIASDSQQHLIFSDLEILAIFIEHCHGVAFKFLFSIITQDWIPFSMFIDHFIFSVFEMSVLPLFFSFSGVVGLFLMQEVFFSLWFYWDTLTYSTV